MRSSMFWPSSNQSFAMTSAALLKAVFIQVLERKRNDEFGEVTSWLELLWHRLIPFRLRRRLNQGRHLGVALDGDEEDRLCIIYHNCSAMVLERSDAAHHPLSKTHVRSR